MWDGDGKPLVWVFRVGYIREFTEMHPDFILGEGDKSYEINQIYDCVDGVPGENLDCWYCDECRSLAVFVDSFRYDFKPMETVPDAEITDFSDWEDYIALRDGPFEEFQEYYDGMRPIDAINSYDFKYRYKVAPAKKTIYAFTRDGKIAFGYICCRFLIFQ